MFLSHFKKVLVAGSVSIVDSHRSSWLPTLFTTSKACGTFQSMYKLHLSCSIRVSAFPHSWSGVSRAHDFFLNLFILFIYFWLWWVFITAHGLSLVAASGGYSSLLCAGFLLQWLLFLWSTGSRHADFSSCGAWAQWLWPTGLVAPQHVGSSWTRDRTHVPCIGRRILIHWATREAQSPWFYLQSHFLSGFFFFFCLQEFCNDLSS